MPLYEEPLGKVNAVDFRTSLAREKMFLTRSLDLYKLSDPPFNQCPFTAEVSESGAPLEQSMLSIHLLNFILPGPQDAMVGTPSTTSTRNNWTGTYALDDPFSANSTAAGQDLHPDLPRF